MTADDSAPFLERLNALAEIFDAKFSEAKQTLYFAALEDLPLDAIKRALEQSARECKFMPRPAELRSMILGDEEDAAELAWMAYKQLARTVGGYNSPTMDAALAESLVAVFGDWQQACWLELSPEMWAAKRKEFGRVYRVMRLRQVTGTRQLTGRIVSDNASKGLLTGEALMSRES